MFRFFPVEFRSQTEYGVVGITQCYFSVKLFIGYAGNFENQFDHHHNSDLVIYCENSSFFWTLSGMMKPSPSKNEADSQLQS